MSEIYTKAGDALEQILRHKKGVKSSVYNLFDLKKKNVALPAVLSIVINTVKRIKILRYILDNARSSLQNHKSESERARLPKSKREFVILAMLYDLLYKNKITGGGALKKQLEDLKSELTALKGKAEKIYKVALENSDQDKRPRYMRCDFSRWNRQVATDWLQAWIEEKGFDIAIHLDKEVPCVLAISGPDSLKMTGDLRLTKQLQEGWLVMMDRGTCLTSYALDVQPGDIVLDICAAPGSKSLHILSQLQTRVKDDSKNLKDEKDLTSNGILICIEMSPNRYQTLVKRMSSESPLTHTELITFPDGNAATVFSNAKLPNLLAAAVNIDALKCVACSPTTCICDQTKDAEGEKAFCLTRLVDLLRGRRAETSVVSHGWKVSCDPSCSGSGMEDHATQMSQPWSKETQSRLELLSEFQVDILKHISANMQPVSTLSYSTCSIYGEENESVVRRFISATTPMWEQAKAVHFWTNKADRTFYYEAKRKTASDQADLGIAQNETELTDKYIMDHSVRIHPELDHCRGFFLAKLQRNMTI